MQADRIMPRAIIVMGVSGSGKSTLGALLAKAIDCPFLEGDAFHSPAAIAKMRAGQPLTDEDRWPWLDRLGDALNDATARGGIAVAACSALKHSYRLRLRERISAPSAFILLDADRGELARRLAGRTGHYMPAGLLDSQLDVLERPAVDEPAIVLDAQQSPEDLCRSARAWLDGFANPPAHD